MTIFVDMDGVLADFDSHYENLFGKRPNKLKNDVNWRLVSESKDFYANIPPMSDMRDLWSAIEHLNPVILTGIPYSVKEATSNKEAWAFKNLGPKVEIRCCLSREKYKHCQPGDVLIDDWEKYRQKWVDTQGIWITHFDAKSTIVELKRLGIIE